MFKSLFGTFNKDFYKSKIFWSNLIMLVLGAIFPGVPAYVQAHPTECLYAFTALNMALRLISKGKVQIE